MSSDERSVTYVNDYNKLATDYLFRGQSLDLYSDIVEIDALIRTAIRALKKEDPSCFYGEPRDKTEDFFDNVEQGSEVFVATRMITERHVFLNNFDDTDLRFFMDFSLFYRISEIEKELKLEDVQEEYFGEGQGEYAPEIQVELMNELTDLQELQNRLRERTSQNQTPERE